MVDDDLKEFVHERFRRADEKLDRVLDVVIGIRDRLGLLEQRVGLLEQRIGALEHRFDGIEARLERIEKRLELVDV